MALFCSECGRIVPDNAVFCEFCGARIQNRQDVAFGNPGEIPAGTAGPTVAGAPVPSSAPADGAGASFQNDPYAGEPYAGGYQQYGGGGNFTPPEPPKKSKLGLIFALAGGGVVVILLVVLFLWPGLLRNKETPYGPGTASGENTEQTQESPSITPTTEASALTTAPAPETTAAPETTTAAPETTTTAPETTTTAPETTTTEPETTVEADFEKLGIKINVVEGAEYAFPTPCYDNEEYTTVGTMSVGSYVVSPANDTMLEFGEKNDMDLDGYVLREVVFDFYFNDENCEQYGAHIYSVREDYYNTSLHDQSYTSMTDSDGDKYVRTEIEYKGQSYYVYSWVSSHWDTDSMPYHATTTYQVLTPEGYDGAVIALIAGDVTQATDLSVGTYSKEFQTYFFQLY